MTLQEMLAEVTGKTLPVQDVNCFADKNDWVSSPGEQFNKSTSAMYIYGVAKGEETINFGAVGLDGREVYTLNTVGLGAIVHDCEPEPYNSNDDEQVKGWLFNHQDVLDKAQTLLGTILPMGFNTIIHASDKNPDEMVKNWLKEERDRLSSLLEHLDQKQEFSVKIFIIEEDLKKKALLEDPELGKLKDELLAKPEGTRYMYQEKLERVVQKALESMADTSFREIYDAVYPLCEDIQIEKTKQVGEGKKMIANLSCLVRKDRVEQLGQVLGGIQQKSGYLVDFTGPWPPYSFVGGLELPGN